MGSIFFAALGSREDNMPVGSSPNTERSMATAYGLIAAILVCGAVGYALDAWLQTRPWLSMLGLISGLVVGLYELVRYVRARTDP
jgi:F0F1-type ATP synthase assembly protein I